MRFGLWYDFRNPAQWRIPWDRLYGETLDQIAWADSLGFDSVWLSEHHFSDEGYLPAMFPLLAAMAMRTSRMRVGTAVLLAPLYHPLRIAEDAAVVDVLSGGRLDLGLAPGYRIEEFQTLSIPRNQRGARMDETLDILLKAWTTSSFSHRGQHFTFEDVSVTPPPLQAPWQLIWIGGSSRASARRAGRGGYGFMADSAAPVELYGEYRRTLESEGYGPERYRAATNRTIHVCDDPEHAWDELKDRYLFVYNRYAQWGSTPGGPPPMVLADPEELPRSQYIVGTPRMVIEQIERVQSELPIDLLIFWARIPGTSIESSSRSIELFARQVMPHFNQRIEGTGTASDGEEGREN